jgi:hypothetical protein
MERSAIRGAAEKPARQAWISLCFIQATTAGVHAMPAVDPYPYVYVNADGTARELHASEQKYLETEFKGGDGAAPYVKSSYEERDGWGELTGYLERSLLPDGIPIDDAPADDPKHAFSRQEYIAWLCSKGAAVTENSDRSLTTSKPRRP